jgi:hypothetical protein
MTSRIYLYLTLLLSLSPAFAQTPAAATAAAPAPVVDPTYAALLKPLVSPEGAVSVENLVLKRDAAIFTFKKGTFYFIVPVDGRITGVVYTGDGEIVFSPPTAPEARNLSVFTRQPVFVEQFKSGVFRFTDSTADEIKAAAGPNPNTYESDRSDLTAALVEVEQDSRKKLNYNVQARLLGDILRGGPGNLFMAFIRGRKYEKLLFTIDPQGADDVSPEEVSLRAYDSTRPAIWAAFHLASEYASGTASSSEIRDPIDIQSHELNVQFEKSGFLRGKARTTINANLDNLRVLPLSLFFTLRVQQVTDAEGKPLPFIQGDRADEDSHFWVILPQPLKKGSSVVINTTYEGKDAVTNEGDGNYFPVARSDWYPNSSFGDYASYDITLTVPKRLQAVATGSLVSQRVEGEQSISVWKSDMPQTVAGFNLGDFKVQQAKEEKINYLVEAWANKNPPDFVKSLQHQTQPQMSLGGNKTESVALGNMSTVSMMDHALSEAKVAMLLYTDYFGPLPYKRIAMTQQTACNFGQSWPTLVYLPICSFFDDSVKHQLGLGDSRGYWRVVGPHEVAHQWFGHLVGFNSYRDQWMSEGFSDFAASLFIQAVWNKPQEYLSFWKDEQDLIVERNKDGIRAIDVGPLTQGRRLGYGAYRRVAYAKGAFILQMIRMMMWKPDTGDTAFRGFMHDFMRDYGNRAVTTEDFKACLEKHMLPNMDLAGNHRMDWFFDQYVYGTALPEYTVTHSFDRRGDGFVLKLKLSQAGVNDKFVMLVPLYLELADGRVTRLGALTLHGNSSFEQEIPLTGLKDPPRRAMVNYNFDVLANAAPSK